MTDYTRRPPDEWTPPQGAPVAVEEHETPEGPTAVRFLRPGDKSTGGRVRLLKQPLTPPTEASAGGEASDER